MVSVDKAPLGLWVQAASAKVFGFSGLSLLVPEALAGVLSVAVLYYLVARVFGAGAGLVAALALALTPVSLVEIAVLVSDGKLTLKTGLNEFFDDLQSNPALSPRGPPEYRRAAVDNLPTAPPSSCLV